MRSFLPLRGLLALLLSLSSLSAARASHQQGGDISYASVASTTAGVPRYHVVVRNFVNGLTLGPISIPAIVPSMPLTATRAGCGTGAANTFTVQAPLTQTAVGPPLVCLPVSTLYTVAQYELDIDLPTGQWILSTNTGVRDNDILNITNSASQGLFLNAYLDNTVVLQNNSPRFESVVRPSQIAGASAPHSFSAFDLDGDSLSYDKVLPYSSCNQPVAGTVTPHFTVDAGTGALVPTTASGTQGQFNIAVRVREYRKVANSWLLIGYIMRDMLYTVSATTTNQPPTFSNITMLTSGGTALAGYPPIAVQRGQTVSISLSATDPDAGQTLRFTSNAPNVVPGLSLTPQVSPPNSVQLTWQVPATLPPGRYAIPVAVLDDGCFTNASAEQTLVFIVSANAPLATRASLNATAEVYPTPFREQVQFKTAPNQAVVLFDALGREVARLTSAADGLVRWQPASALPAGLYLARAAADGRPLARLLRAE